MNTKTSLKSDGVVRRCTTNKTIWQDYLASSPPQASNNYSGTVDLNDASTYAVASTTRFTVADGKCTTTYTSHMQNVSTYNEWKDQMFTMINCRKLNE